MDNDKDIYQILAEINPSGKYNEEDVWAAIAEANDLDYDPSDGDLAEWL